MAGRKIKDEQEALASLSAVARTGLELSEWCRARDIDTRSLAGWRGVLEARGHSFDDLQFVELVPGAPPTPSSYRVHCGPFAVEVDSSFDDAVLSRLLQVVAAC